MCLYVCSGCCTCTKSRLMARPVSHQHSQTLNHHGRFLLITYLTTGGAHKKTFPGGRSPPWPPCLHLLRVLTQIIMTRHVDLG